MGEEIKGMNKKKKTQRKGLSSQIEELILKLKITRWFLPSLFAIFCILIFVTPVLASIAQPDEISLDGIWAYQNCREDGDQLYLCKYTIDYTTNPDENASEAFLLRYMDGDDTLDSTSPYAYYNAGYGEGVVALYFDADDAPTWEGIYTMELLGNPFQEWEGGVPIDSVSAPRDFDAWEDNEMNVTRVIVSGRILDLASELETSWGKDMVTEADSGEQVLASYGAAYFFNVVPYLSDITPNVFAEGEELTSGVIEPEIPDRDPGTGYSDYLVDQITGTMFDFSALADELATTRSALTALLYYGFVLFVSIKASAELKSSKPMMLLSIPWVILGAFVGVPLIVTILAGFAAFGFTAYALLYKPSTA